MNKPQEIRNDNAQLRYKIKELCGLEGMSCNYKGREVCPVYHSSNIILIKQEPHDKEWIDAGDIGLLRCLK